MKIKFIFLQFCSLLLLASCKKENLTENNHSTKEISETNVSTYRVYMTVYKLEQVANETFNYEISAWVANNTDSTTALLLPANLRINFTIEMGNSSVQRSIILKKGTYISRQFVTLKAPVTITGNFTAPDSYNGSQIIFNGSFTEKVYQLQPIQVAGTGFADANGKHFIPWGVNYTNTNQLRLIDDNWMEDSVWSIILQDFREMKALNMNLIRIHLQYNKFMLNTTTPNQESLNRLRELVAFAGTYGMYVDITGLCAYILEDSPPWYDALDEAGRWATQAVCWKSVAQAVSEYNNVFVYNLMNEPITPTKRVDTWVVGEPFGGYYFVQYLTQTPRGRTWETVTRSWSTTLKNAIHEADNRTPISIGFIGLGVIAKFNDILDYNSMHIYPEAGKVNEAIAIVENNQTSKPLIIEETNWFAGYDDMRTFINTTMNENLTAGYLSHYHGETIAELEKKTDLLSAIQREWYKIFCFELNPNAKKPY